MAFLAPEIVEGVATIAPEAESIISEQLPTLKNKIMSSFQKSKDVLDHLKQIKNDVVPSNQNDKEELEEGEEELAKLNGELEQTTDPDKALSVIDQINELSNKYNSKINEFQSRIYEAQSLFKGMKNMIN